MADPQLTGAAFCRSLSDATDAWLRQAAENASGGSSKKVALLAVGGYGRRELCPFSDLDLVLVHDSRRDIKKVAEALWYPTWDQGVQVDHSVRRPKEVLALASKDLRVALGLLDARLIWGDERVIDPMLAKLATLWRGSLASEFLPELESQMEQRHRSEGDVAFLLEPNLKEAHGGLRDAAVLRSLPAAAPHLAELVDLEDMRSATETLTAVRVELHRNSGRALDRFLLQEQDQVAANLGYEDADALCRVVSEAGRSIARLSDELWRRRTLWAPGGRLWRDGPAKRVSLEPGIVLLDGEIGLDPAADLVGDPSLPWRLASVAAEQDLPLSLRSLHRLADELPGPPDLWAPHTTASFVRLLRSGRTAVAPFESLDQVGVVARLIPEWEHVRHYHQRNAYHRFTVDRHLLETAANAAEFADGIDRVDLLLLGALFHDIGKGLPGDHTEVGIDLVAQLGPRLGLNPSEVRTLQTLVRHHLLLADTATRRDLSDPRTIETVADAVGDQETLALLGVLTKADSLATGSSAWGPWKEQLVNALVAATSAHLGGPAPVATEETAEPSRELVDAVAGDGLARLVLAAPSVLVAAPDRRGLLSDLAGVLALSGLSILSADATSVEEIALDTFVVEPSGAGWPPAEQLEATLRAVLAGDLELSSALAQRQATYASARRTWSAHPTPSSVLADNEASADATVVEVRAADEIGLLHRLTDCLARVGLDVSAARVATIGGEVVDAFYVRTEGGEKVTEPERLDRVLGALRALLDS